MRSVCKELRNVVSPKSLDRRPALGLLLGCVLLATAQAQSVQPVLILLGPPASGKSTQAALIQKRYGFALITREQLMQDDPSLLARQKQPDIRGVEPRVDPALNNLFMKRLEKTDISKGLLLDGYPASKDHGDFLVKVLQDKGLNKPLILQLELPDDAVRKRLKNQKTEQIEQDLKDYHRETDFLSAYFPEAEIVKIDGSKKEDAVFAQIRKAIDGYLKNPGGSK
jgi:adenylate kinase family enzyme